MNRRENKLVTAIITTHNRFSLLKRAIDSVLQQTYSNIELIVVDDASTDGTLEYCLNKSFNYIYIPKVESRGGNYARNIGIKAAKGEYIAFLDDDDYWLPSKIEKQVNLLNSKNTVGLVFCGMINHVITFNDEKYINNPPKKCNRGNMSRSILTSVPFVTSTLMIRKSVFENVGLFDENLRYWQEYEFAIRLSQKANIDFIDENLVIYLVDKRGVNRLSSRYIEWLDAVQYVKNKHRELYKRENIFERWTTKSMIYHDAKQRARLSLPIQAYRKLSFYSLIYSFLSIPYRINRKFQILYSYE